MNGQVSQSIVIPTYNRKEMLSEAINSVLKQSHKDFELIVIDDCSTDGTGEYVKSIPDERIKYFRNETNLGLETNRNIGLKKARGKYITFLDDDDYYTDYDFFAKAVKIFEEHDNTETPIAFVCANAVIFNVDADEMIPLKIGGPGRISGIDYVFSRKCRKPLSTFPTLFRTDILKRAGLLDMIIFDSETYIQAALEGDAWFMEDCIGVYRSHKESTTYGYKKHPAQLERLKAKVMAMAERRVLIYQKLLQVTDKKSAQRWCIYNTYELLKCYRGQQTFINEVKIYGGAMLLVARHIPMLLPMIPYLKIKNTLRKYLRKITPLRKLYRFIKYGSNAEPIE